MLRASVPVHDFSVFSCKVPFLFADLQPETTMAQNEKITINDIARRTGLSKGTVDRVLHNRGEVSRKSYERVMEVIRELGYEPIMLTDQLCCQAREAGSFLASILKTHASDARALAFIAGGETVVKLTGHGKGGRNQEIALSAAAGIAGLERAAVFSVGSDGTDGPTDAAGGYADGDTCRELLEQGITIDAVLQDNDAYHALEKTGGLIITGPTGTNVNDVAVALLN